jgi:hypothetical protein
MSKRSVTRAILIVLTAACGICVVVSVPLALMAAAMVLDAPDSAQHLWVWGAFLASLSIPLWFIAGAGLGWLLHLRGFMLASLAVAAAPLIAAVIGLALMMD